MRVGTRDLHTLFNTLAHHTQAPLFSGSALPASSRMHVRTVRRLMQRHQESAEGPPRASALCTLSCQDGSRGQGLSPLDRGRNPFTWAAGPGPSPDTKPEL